MKLFKRVFFLSCVFILSLLFLSNEAEAAENTAAPQIKQDIIQIQSSEYIKEGNSSIRKKDSQTISSSCSTYSYSSVQQVSCNIYLQVRDKASGNWYTTDSNKRFVNYTSKSVSGSVNFKVEKGHRYRVRTIHSISHYGTIEQLISVTGSLSY
ncbi:DUF6147 family protein [Gracilibacillus caseinilyticus]|uniref:DUF6147 family protein n=1 Tax=Gracilibacillus caseinilyticus TaxID=2932256 RepID=A0ABY4EZ07_9BACI|nr:DUF6147 family protein [Gracilibacillus caseinilyticus]UOQ49246.1 DUF6147 family protein [Gracilibacillus caseinilyticus]